MSWVKLDDGMLDHPKWIVALTEGGSGALHLWLGMTLWSARYLTDGVIPAAVLATLPGPGRKRDRAKALRGLTTARLVTVDDHGTATLVNYLEYQPSRTATLRERERRIEGQQNRRHDERPPDKRDTRLIPPCPVPSRPVPSRPVQEERERDPDARAPEISNPPVELLRFVGTPPQPELDALRNWIPLEPPTVPGLLGPSKRELARSEPPGTTPGLRYAFSTEWDPSLEHRQRGLELGLTDEQILERAEHCRRKAYPAGIRSEDDQFFRELMWLRNDLEKQRFRESASARRRFENPGSDRTA